MNIAIHMPIEILLGPWNKCLEMELFGHIKARVLAIL